MNALEHTPAVTAAESIILAELATASLPPPELKKRVRAKVKGLKDKECKAHLDALIAAQRIHALFKPSKTGKPSKTIEAYSLGAPPPPPPPPPPPRELAPDEILSLLHRGPLTPAALKTQLNENVPGLTAADFKAILAELVATRRIYARPKRDKTGKPTKTIEGYSLGGPPAGQFIAPLLVKWKEVCSEAAAAGVTAEALAAALVEGLAKQGVEIRLAESEAPAGDDRSDVLKGVRELVAREGHGALIPIRKLRGALRLPKDRFDTAVLELYGQDTLILHHHDYVGNLSDAERDELVLDRHGNYYIGVALRGEA